MIADVLAWLEPLLRLLPETVKLEMSSSLLIAALLALWIWRRGGGHRRND